MNDQMRTAMAEAARLMREGRIAEANALIQRTLGGATGAAPAEARVRVVEESPTRPGSPLQSSGPGGARYADQRERMAKQGGRFVDGAFSNSTGRRPFKLYVPRNYTGQAVPLVIMLHGCTQSTVDFAAGTRMNTFAEGKILLVVYPEQASSANNSKCWNWFQPADQQRGKGEPSLIAGITRQVTNSYNVDSQRVYIAGLSAGGAMAVIMAATYPDLYAAVGVHSGLAYGAAHDLHSGFAAMRSGPGQSIRQLPTAIPLIAFHGDRDTTVSPLNADHLLDQWLRAYERGGSTLATRIEDGQAANGRAYTRSTYADTGGRTFMEKWLIHQAGHAWSGGSPAGSFADPRGPDASSELLRFFAEHVRKS